MRFTAKDVPNLPKSLILRRAEEVARGLTLLPLVNEIWLYGSLSREGNGRDIDLVIVANEVLMHQFAQQMHYSLKGSYGHPVERWNVAQHVLRVPLALRKAFASIVCGELDAYMIVEMLGEEITTDVHAQFAAYSMVDPYIVSPEWRDRIPEVKKLHPYSHEFLFENIAEDAVPFDPECGEFEIPTPPPAS